MLLGYRHCSVIAPEQLYSTN